MLMFSKICQVRVFVTERWTILQFISISCIHPSSSFSLSLSPLCKLHAQQIKSQRFATDRAKMLPLPLEIIENYSLAPVAMIFAYDAPGGAESRPIALVPLLVSIVNTPLIEGCEVRSSKIRTHGRESNSR